MVAADAFERTDLPGGLRILTERMPSVRSVTLGLWAGGGGCGGDPKQSRVSHPP
jgi:predicted Zn-dependent peptidase